MPPRQRVLDLVEVRCRSSDNMNILLTERGGGWEGRAVSASTIYLHKAVLIGGTGLE